MNIDLEFDIESEYKSRLKFWDANGNRNSSLGFIPLWFIKDIHGEPAKVGSHFISSAFFVIQNRPNNLIQIKNQFSGWKD